MELGQMKQWAGRVVSAAAVAILFLTTGCAGFFVYPGSLPGGGSGSGAGDDVYVINQTANLNAGTLVGYSIGTNSLTAVTGSPQNITTFAPVTIAVNRTNTMLFVAGGNVINTYAIGSGGALSLLTSNTNLVEDAVAIDVSPDGQWLLGLDANGTPLKETLIDEYSISSNGVLTAGPANGTVYPQQASQGPLEPSAIKFAPNGQLVFLALGTAGDLVYGFTTSSGALSPNPTQTITVPNSFTADLAVAVPNNSYVYFARSSGSVGSVVTCPITGTTVVQANCNSVSAGDRPAAVVVNGTDVYVANEFSVPGTISGYSGAATGNLTQLSLSPYSISAPTALAVDHSGAYLLAVSDTTGVNNLTMYSYDSSGNLVSPTSLNTGSLPVGLAATY
jgi:6-phosphogluconolactonase (cycloisomerase 2 family)